MDVSEMLVTGGTGLLGRRVVDRLRAGGHEARVLSRSGRGEAYKGDLITGEGLDAALRGVGTVVHCASSPTRKTRRVDVGGTGRLLEAASQAGVSHAVYISIVGVDRNPYFPYYRAKLDAERVVEGSSVPWTILRATQFHDFLLAPLRLAGRLPVAPVPKGFLFQPVDVSEVAGRLVELALGEPAGRVPDVGGPEVRTVAELARAYFATIGRRRSVVEIPVPGKAARAFREGAQVRPDRACGRIGWEEFLRARRPGNPS